MKSLIAALWDKITSKKKLKYLHNVDFQYLSDEEDKIVGISILRGKYAGVIYRYGTAKVIEEGEFARLSFSYTILNSSKFTSQDLQNDEDFHTMIGDILTEILTEQENEKTRNNNFEELDIQ